MLDGRQASEFALLTGAAFSGAISASNFYTPATASTLGEIGGANSIIIYGSTGLGGDQINSVIIKAGDAARARFTSSGTSLSGTTTTAALASAGAITQAGNQVWHAGNDGTGSGLDADLLDGRQASEFALLSGAAFAGPLSAPAISSSGTIVANGIRTSDAGIGYIGLIPGTAENTGYVEFRRAGGVRQGYIGFMPAGGAIPFVSETGQGFTFSGGLLNRDGSRVWDSGNDGAGSGLDADLLDGRQASEFALLSGATFSGDVFGRGISLTSRITAAGGLFCDANFGLVKVNEFLMDLHFDDGAVLRYDRSSRSISFFIDGFGYLVLTAAGIALSAAIDTTGPIRQAGNQVWHVANDGAGSGLDADLLDGRQASEFALLGANVTFGEVMSTAGAYRFGINNNYIQYADGFNFCIDFAPVAVIRAGAITRAGLPVWDAGNDGAGSGMDADLLDGRHASDFALLSDFANQLPGTIGYQCLPGGLILQWGNLRSNFTTELTTIVNFPIAFPTACLTAQATGYINAANNQRDLWPQIVGTPSTAGMTIQLQSDDDSDHFLQGVNWIAIGY